MSLLYPFRAVRPLPDAAARVVAQQRDLVRLRDLVAPVCFRGQHVARIAVGDQRIVHFANCDLHGLLVFEQRLVAPRRGQLDLRLDPLPRAPRPPGVGRRRPSVPS